MLHVLSLGVVLRYTCGTFWVGSSFACDRITRRPPFSSIWIFPATLMPFAGRFRARWFDVRQQIYSNSV